MNYQEFIERLNWHLRIEHDGFDFQKRALDEFFARERAPMARASATQFFIPVSATGRSVAEHWEAIERLKQCRNTEL